MNHYISVLLVLGVVFGGLALITHLAVLNAQKWGTSPGTSLQSLLNRRGDLTLCTVLFFGMAIILKIT